MTTERKNIINEASESSIQKLIAFLRLNNRKILLFLFFVLLSTVFWFIRALGNHYESVVEYPVRYTNFPEGKQLAADVPDKLTLTINATGFTILKSKLNLNLIPVRFDVASFLLNNTGDDMFFVVTQSVRNILSSELNDVTILDIYPDTLYFRLTDINIRKVKVNPVLDNDERFFSPQHMQNGEILVDPDSVVVSGPAYLLDSLTVVNTEPVMLSGLTDTTEVTADLIDKEGLAYSQSRVRLVIPVDRFTEVNASLPVTGINVPEGSELIPIPGQVRISYKVSLSNYSNAVNTKSFMLHIDYNDIVTNGNRPWLKVFLSDTPVYINDIRLNPAEIEFLIRKDD